MKDKRSFFAGMAVGFSIMFIINIFFVGAQFVSRVVGTTKLSSTQKISKIVTILNQKYVDEINHEQLQEGIYKGLVAAVGDPYTTYFNKKEYDRFTAEIEATYAGIGVVVSVDPKDQLITVVSPFEGSPGAMAGILPGDKILKVNNFEVFGDGLEEAVSMIKGPVGTTVNLTLFRKNENRMLELSVRREKIDIPTVSHKMLDDQIGYLRISGFDAVTYDQFLKAYVELTKQGQKGLIIDLRNNPGGLMHIVAQIADELLPKGTIVYTENKAGEKEFLNSDQERRIHVPLVLLVNGYSASASEILAGAVKDHNIGKLVGTTTFGKGLVQSSYKLGDGSAIKVTISKYFTPSGVCIQGIGIEPDYIVKLPEELENKLTLEEAEDIQLQKAVEVIQEQLR